MFKPLRIPLVGLLLLLPLSLAAAQDAEQAQKDAGQKMARDYTNMFYAGELEKIFGEFSGEMKTAVPLEKLSGIYQQWITRFGKETELVSEDLMTQGEITGYRRIARFEQGSVLEILWAVRPSGEIAGFSIRPASEPEKAPAN